MLGRESDVWASFLFAFSLHAVLIIFLSLSWEWSLYSLPTERPKSIEAQLIRAEPEAEPEPQRRRPPRQTNTAPTPVRSEPVPQPVTQPNPEPVVIEEPAPVSETRPARIPPAQREMRDELSLDDALSIEDDAFQSMTEEQQAASKESTIRAKFANQVAMYWSRPPSARNGMEVVIRIQLVPSGEVVSATVVNASGDPAFDRSALEAIRQAAPYEFVLEFGQAFFNERLRTMTVVFRPEDLK